MMIRTIAFAGVLGFARLLDAAAVRYVGDGAAVVIPSDSTLVYTRQVVGVDVPEALDNLDAQLRATEGHVGAVLRLHFGVASETLADAARRTIRTRYTEGRRPA